MMGYRRHPANELVSRFCHDLLTRWAVPENSNPSLILTSEIPRLFWDITSDDNFVLVPLQPGIFWRDDIRATSGWFKTTHHHHIDRFIGIAFSSPIAPLAPSSFYIPGFLGKSYAVNGDCDAIMHFYWTRNWNINLFRFNYKPHVQFSWAPAAD